MYTKNAPDWRRFNLTIWGNQVYSSPKKMSSFCR